MKTASISQTKNQLSALLDAVRHGETILIMDRNCPVARLEPVTEMSGMGAQGCNQSLFFSVVSALSVVNKFFGS